MMAKPWRLACSIVALILLTGCQQRQTPIAAKAAGFTGCFSGPATYCAEIAEWDVAVVARLVQPSPLNALQDPQGKFEIVEVLKGRGFVPAGQPLTLGIDSSAAAGDLFVLVADMRDGLQWDMLTPLSPTSQQYLTALFRLPNAAERQQFQLKNLAASDERVADDASHELQSLRYSELQYLKPHLQHDEIVAQIQNPEISANQRRFYFSLLSICGSEEDLPLLEKILHSTNRQERAGLDAAITCYLTLRGTDGLPLMEQLFLQDKQASYADTYSAIMAVRFHLHEAQVIDRDRLIESLRLMLLRPELADLVIPDLAAQHDWTVIEQLFELYKTADTKNTWLRVPVINFLRQCPLPRAKEMLVECAQIDPAAVERANTFFQP